LNVAPAIRDDLRIADSVNNIAVSISASFSGSFIVIAGALANRVGSREADERRYCIEHPGFAADRCLTSWDGGANGGC
jgi:hypothetical protein